MDKNLFKDIEIGKAKPANEREHSEEEMLW